VVQGGRLNPRAVRQISGGSIIGTRLLPFDELRRGREELECEVEANERIGLCAGLLVSTFSRSLALILGLLVVGVQVSSIFI
jgi:hypothetical protein